MTYSLTNAAIGSVNLLAPPAGKITIESERSNKDSNLFKQPIPTSDSGDTIVIDIFGAQKNVTLKCEYIGTSVANISTYIGYLDAILDGEQSVSTYTSDAAGTSIYVYFENFEWEYEAGSPLTIKITLSLIHANGTI